MGRHNFQAQRGLSDVVCALPMPGALFFHTHPRSRHTLGRSFSLGHGGEENKARHWSSTSQESSERTVCGSQDLEWVSPGFAASPNWISLLAGA